MSVTEHPFDPSDLDAAPREGEDEGRTPPPRGERASSVAWWRPPADRQERWAFGLFAAFAIVGGVLILTVFGRGRWFIADEWDFLSDRSATNVHDLFRDHQGHWSTIPILIYRALYGVFGVRTYLPYQAVLVTSHLAIAFMLRAVIRRTGVGPWIASATAAVIVLYGPGSDEIVWAFQIGYTGAIAFGLAQLLLADHDGRIGRRDALAILASIAALLCSGVGPVMVAVVGITCLIRWGWRRAALQTVPAAVIFVTWYLIDHPSSGYVGRGPNLTDLTGWLRSGTLGTAAALFKYSALGLVPVVVVIGGAVLAARREGTGPALRRGAPALAMLVGFAVFQLSDFPSRWFLGAPAAAGGRYLYVLTLLCLPAIAFGADAFARRWPVAVPITVVALLAPLPWYVSQFDTNNQVAQPFQNDRVEIARAAHLPELDVVPSSVRIDPDPYILGPMTAGWLRRARDAGKLPDDTPPASAVTDDNLRLRLGLGQWDTPIPTSAQCRDSTDPVTLRPQVGDQIGFTSAVSIRQLKGGKPYGLPVVLDPRVGGRVMHIGLPNMEFTVQSSVRGEPYSLCT
jgi:hypothetical protein